MQNYQENIEKTTPSKTCDFMNYHKLPWHYICRCNSNSLKNAYIVIWYHNWWWSVNFAKMFTVSVLLKGQFF